MKSTEFFSHNEALVTFLAKVKKQIATNPALVAIDEPSTTALADIIDEAISQIRDAEAEVWDWLSISAPGGTNDTYPQSAGEMVPSKIVWTPLTERLNNERKYFKELTPNVSIKTIVSTGSGSPTLSDSAIFPTNDIFAQALYDLDGNLAIMVDTMQTIFDQV